MKNHNHYERAFEAYARSLKVLCLPTHETHRGMAADCAEFSLKNFDFILSADQFLFPTSWIEKPVNYASLFTGGGPNLLLPAQSQISSQTPSVQCTARISWLADVKGRKFPTGQRSPQYWRNWVAEDDLSSLSRWENIFGTGFHGIFIFAYEVCGKVLPLPENRLFEMENRRYAFFAFPLAIYRDYCRKLSPRWGTTTLSTAVFKKFAVPFDEFFLRACDSPQ